MTLGAKIRVPQDVKEQDVMIDRARLTEVYARERQGFAARHPRSAAAYQRSDHLSYVA
jgi:hypothetical protein